jgi:magnesium chelatase subunit D
MNPDQLETEPDQDAHEQQESSPLEAVFATGQDFKIRRLVFKKDRLKRRASGRRTKTQSKDKGGRYVKSGLRDNGDVAIDATLRAAAPMQGLRARQSGLNIQQEDLRYKKREKRMGHLTIFVVDGSGSMGANQRMIETKGAIMSLLSDCYRRRDKVAMIVFRKDRAELVLQPTSSVAFAARSLRELPVGGKTPLAAGLLEAYRLIEATGRKAPETRCLLTVITDGRANAGLGAAKIREEVGELAGRLAQMKGCDRLVIDTEDKRGLFKMHLARSLAQDLGADYYTPDELKAEYLQDVVRQSLAALEA